MMQKLRLSTKLLATFLFISLVTSAATGAFVYVFEKRNLENETVNNLFLFNEARAILVQSYLNQQISRAIDFSSDGFIRDSLERLAAGPNAEATKALNEHLIKNKFPIDKELFEIEILDNKGIVMAAINTDEIGEDYSEVDFFKKACELDYGGACLGPISLYENEDYTSHLPVLTFSAPLTNRLTGEKIGVLANRVKLISLDQFLTLSLEVENSFFFKSKNTIDTYIVGQDGFILTKPRFGGSDLVLNHKITDKEIGCGFAGFSRNFSGKDVFLVNQCLPNGWIIFTEIGKEELLKNITLLGENIILLGIGLAALLFLLSYFPVRRIIKPLKQLALTAEKLGKGDLKQRAAVTSGNEIGQLAASFNLMADKLGVMYGTLEDKVAEKTKALSLSLEELTEKNKALEDTKNQLFETLEDLDRERGRLAEEKAKDEALLGSIADAVMAIDVNGKIIFINKKAEEWFGVAEEAAKGRPYADICTIEQGEFDEPKKVPESERPINKALKTGKVIQTSAYYLMAKGNKRIPVSITVSPVVLKGKTAGAIDVIRDITEEKRIERSKNEFVSIASHQLRTPLTAIKWYIESLLAGDAGKLNKKQQKYFEEVYRGSERMANLIGALLDASRIELGTLVKDRKDIVLKTECEKIIGELNVIIEKKKLKIVQKYEDNIPRIKSDPRAVRLILQNIISNAVKYTAKGGDITISVEKSGSRALVSVADNGVGIPRDAQDKIFTKFFRADNVKPVDQEGTGLGLYIAKQAIEQLKGKIWFDTILGKGTTFYVELPLNNNTEEA